MSCRVIAIVIGIAVGGAGRAIVVVIGIAVGVAWRGMCVSCVHCSLLLRVVLFHVIGVAWRGVEAMEYCLYNIIPNQYHTLPDPNTSNQSKTATTINKLTHQLQPTQSTPPNPNTCNQSTNTSTMVLQQLHPNQQAIQIIKTAVLAPSACKRVNLLQFFNTKISFPITHRLARPPAPQYKSLYKATRPNVAMY